MFLNLEDGKITVNSYRLPTAKVCYQDELLEAKEKGSKETLTCRITKPEKLPIYLSIQL